MPDAAAAQHCIAAAMDCLNRHDYTGGESHAKAALTHDPYAANAHHLLGVCRFHLGRAEAALAHLAKAADLAPEDYHIHNNWGNIAKALAHDEPAARAYARATELNPQAPEAWYNRALMTASLGDAQEAVGYYHKALEVKPAFALAHINLAAFYVNSADFESAVTHAQHATDLAPDNADAWFNLGAAQLGLNHLLPAKHHFEKALACDNEHVHALQGMGQVASLQSCFAEAQSWFMRALSLPSATVTSALGVLRAMEHQGHVHKALTLLESTLTPRFKDDVSLRCRHIDLLEKLHRRDDAVVLLRPLLETHATQPDVVLQATYFRGPLGLSDEAVETMLSTCVKEMGDPLPAEAAPYLYAQAKIPFKDKRVDEAMALYDQANALTRQPFSRGLMREKHDYIRRTLAAREATAWPQAEGPVTPRLVFVVGMPRSGSTLVEQILGAHPGAVGLGELDDFATLVSELDTQTGHKVSYPDVLSRLNAPQLSQVARTYRERIEHYVPADQGDATCWIDKNLFNYQHLGLIRMLFPQAAIIHTQRDAMDTGFSIYRQNFMRHIEYACDLSDIGFAYSQYWEHMAFYREWGATHLNVLDVPYESLVGDPEGWTKTMLDHIGLPFDESCLRYHESGGYARTASFQQVRRPIYQEGKAQWCPYAQYLSPLADALPPNLRPKSPE